MADEHTHSDGGAVFRLIYRSRLTVDGDDWRPAVANILAAARRKNPALGITGALVVWDASVVQTLEGDEDAVRGLYRTITDDPRHTDVALVETGRGARAFAKWSMAQVSDYDEADFPLRTNQWEGGVDVHGWKALISPEQDLILTKMRERVRGATA